MSGLIARGLAAGLRIFGSQFENDKICGRCATVIDGRCMCASPYPYRRLSLEKHNRPVKITFWKNVSKKDGSVTIDVERDMCVHDLCDIIAPKMGYSTTAFWTLVEHWEDKKCERVLEEHEIMVDVYKEMLKFKRKAKVRYILRQDVAKFDFMVDPSRLRLEGGVICEDPTLFKDFHMVCFIEKLVDESLCPVFFSRSIMLYDKGWRAVFILLKDGILYYVDDRFGQTTLLEMSEMDIRRHLYPEGPLNLRDIPGIVQIGELSELEIYSVIKGGLPKLNNSVTNGFLLRPTATPNVRRRRDSSTVDPFDPPAARIPVLPKGVFRCASLSPNFATTWIALMRLAKYGKQLRENYRAFKNKNESPPKDFGRANVPNPELESPLFRRRGCEPHLAERAKKVGSHDHLFLMDFSGGLAETKDPLDGYDKRIDGLVLGMYLAPWSPKMPMHRMATPLKLILSSRFERGSFVYEPGFRISGSRIVRSRPSKSRSIEERRPSEDRADAGRRFGAIRKILSSKKSTKKGNRRNDEETAEGIEFTPMNIREESAETTDEHQETVIAEAILVDIEPDALPALPTEDEGATSMNYYSVSPDDQKEGIITVQIHKENEENQS